MSKIITRKLTGVLRHLAAGSVALILGQPVLAQNLFSPVARVNDMLVTEYEVQQRQRFLRVLNAPGGDRETVIETLIDDRLRSQAVAAVGIELTEEGLAQSLTEFASRANLSTAEFVQALKQAGVDEETFRDFVVNSVSWRELIRGRFLNSVQITDDDVDLALSQSRDSTGIRVLLSEIIIPAPPQNAAQVNALAERISQSSSQAEFSNFAREYSATASRGNGGRMPWTPLDNLPPSLHPILLGLDIGEITAPLPIPNAVALFQLRGIQEVSAPRQNSAEIEYATYFIPGGRSDAALAEAARIRAQIDVCKDLYGVAQGQPEDRLTITAESPGAIPRDIAIELAKLDPGESSVALTRSNGQNLMFLMLCKRTASGNTDATRQDVINALRQRKLQGYADSYIAQLRANARILRP